MWKSILAVLAREVLTFLVNAFQKWREKAKKEAKRVKELAEERERIKKGVDDLKKGSNDSMDDRLDDFNNLP